MPTPTTTPLTRRVSNLQVGSIYCAAWAQIRPAQSDRLDAIVPWDLANLYLQAAREYVVRDLKCDPITGARGELLGHLTGAL